MIRGDIRHKRRGLDTLSQKAYNLHMSLEKELHCDLRVSIEARTTLKVERSL